MDFNLSTPRGSEVNTFDAKFSVISELTKLVKHGGIYGLADSGLTQRRFEAIAEKQGLNEFFGLGIKELSTTLAAVAKTFFYRLHDGHRYNIFSSLLSHITFPHEGRVYSNEGENAPNSQVPAFLTFVGQFIDHDLTLNMFNLVGRAGEPGDIDNEASAFIDLDSVYGSRTALNTSSGYWDIFDRNGMFKLRSLTASNAYDLIRMPTGEPYIFDKRNDENQLILQVHILLMRVHNKFAATLPPPDTNNDQSIMDFVRTVQTEVARNWQSFIWYEYLPAIIDKNLVEWVQQEIQKPDHGAIKHRPVAIKGGKPDQQFLGMPHEFSIGFRMGHSQLRGSYILQPGGTPVDLFDNRSVEGNDLRGNRPLTATHVIDWRFFSTDAELSNLIDDKVTNKVFDLPETTIPDDVKGVGNLPQRNLIRSEQVEIASGEELARFYDIPEQEILKPDEIETDPVAQRLFKLDNQGHYADANPHRTPLWYYVLMEAKLKSQGKQLGPLGGRLIAEVIAGGIYYNTESFLRTDKWKSKITKQETAMVTFKDLVDYVTV